MKKESISTKEISGSRNAGRLQKGSAPRAVSHERIDAIFSSVGQKLREGQSGEAEQILIRTIESYAHKPDDFANLKRLLSFTLETLGRYEESLDAVRPFESDETLGGLKLETQVKVT